MAGNLGKESESEPKPEPESESELSLILPVRSTYSKALFNPVA